MPKTTTKAVTFTSVRGLWRFFVVRRLSTLAKWRQYQKEVKSAELTRNSYLIMKIVLNATIVTVFLFLAILCVSFVSGNTHVGIRIFMAVGVLAYLGIISLFIKKQKLLLSGWMLVILYTAASTLLFLGWGLNTPVGILTYGFIILLAGIILGARYIIPVTFIIILLLTIIHFASVLGITAPDFSDLSKPSDYTDLLGYIVIFSIFALISWLSGRKMEQALQQALTAEAALQEEKDLLAVRLEEQTQRLRAVQLEEMRQLYRFAELGQLSTIIMHELANHLTVLTLDIDDIGQRHKRSTAITRAKESIGYLDAMVEQVRYQLNVSYKSEKFNALTIVTETVESLRLKASTAGVTITTHLPTKDKSLVVKGDPLRLSQIVTIIMTNAIDAYSTMKKLPSDPKIDVEVTAKKTSITISITDHGIGISDVTRQHLFEPFQTTKKTGMGIGLFVVKEMMKTHFKGSVALDPRTDHTKFIITVPRQRGKGHQ